MLSRALHFPVSHWRGEVALWPTLILTLVGLRLFIAGIGGLNLFVLDAGLFVWQVIGALRTIFRHQRDTPDFLSAVAGYAAILICIPAFVWPQLDRIAQKNMPAIKQQMNQDSGLILVPTVAMLEGDIDFVMFDALEDALARHDTVKHVVLDSHGGRVYAARAIAKLIRDYKLKTYVDGTCASACTLAFIAGGSRSLGPSGRLGFHGYSSQSNIQVNDASEEEGKDRAAFLAHGVSAAFVEQMFQAAPQDMWFPSAQELLEAGVITKP